MYIRKIVFAFVALIMVACSTNRPNAVSIVRGGTQDLNDVQMLAAVSRLQTPTAVSQLRSEQLKDAAMSISAQAGLAWRAKQIDAVLLTHERHLNKIFNFSGMLIDQHVMPPILREARETVNLSGDNALRIADRVYEIKTQAHFVTMPQTWRDYLMMQYEAPESPNASLLPRSPRESDIWKIAATDGWQKGVAQADEIFQDNLARLKEDFTGMALYRKLLAERMVSRPFVVRTPLGVTGNKDKVRVNDEVLRITALPELIPQSRDWEPVVRP